MTTKIEIPQWNSMKTPFKEWRTQLTQYFAASGDAELLDKSQKPTAETNYLPVASTPDAFIAKCAKHDQAELLVRWTAQSGRLGHGRHRDVLEQSQAA